MIGIVDYGSGNVLAIANIYKRLNIPYSIMSKPNELHLADKLILPGVGAFDETMDLFNKSGLKLALDELVMGEKRPVLGVCVGMQIMAEGSDEGELKGFGWIKGHVKKIDESKLQAKPHIPHLGWNSVSPMKKDKLFYEIDDEFGFYFLHTYYFSCQNDSDILSTTFYGEEFSSAVNSDNVYGVQFHPEKSHANGIQLFKNFAELC